MNEPITDRRKRPQPEPGARWLDYVPAWARIGIPLCTVAITLTGFAIGWGEGQGRASAQIDGLGARADRYERQRDTDAGALAGLRSEVAELRGEVRAIGRALGIPMPPRPALPEPGPVVREAPEVVP